MLNPFKKSEIEYRPWESSEWEEVFKKSELRLSKQRVYTLSQYLKHSLSFRGDVIEMGVYKGCTAYVLGHFMNEYFKHQNAGTGERVTLWLCDTFEGTPETFNKSMGDVDRTGKYANTSVCYVKEKLSGCYDKVEFVEGFIPDSLENIKQQTKFCFAHIHLNLYESTRSALLWLKDRMSDMGIVIIEDYGISGCKGVRKAVHKLTEEGFIDCIYLPTGQAIVWFKRME